MSKFSKRHYILIAKIFNKYNLLYNPIALEIVYSFVDLFLSDNDLFNKDRFLKACGIVIDKE